MPQNDNFVFKLRESVHLLTLLSGLLLGITRISFLLGELTMIGFFIVLIYYASFQSITVLRWCVVDIMWEHAFTIQSYSQTWPFPSSRVYFTPVCLSLIGSDTVSTRLLNHGTPTFFVRNVNAVGTLYWASATVPGAYQGKRPAGHEGRLSYFAKSFFCVLNRTERNEIEFWIFWRSTFPPHLLLPRANIEYTLPMQSKRQTRPLIFRDFLHWIRFE